MGLQPDELSVPSVVDRFDGTGKLSLGDDGSPIACALSLEYERYSGATIVGKCSVHDPGRARSVGMFSQDGFSFVSDPPSSARLAVGWITRLQTKGSLIEFWPSMVTFGDPSVELEAGTSVALRASLAGSPRLRADGIETVSYEGTSEFESLYQGEIAWKARQFSCKAIERYDFVAAKSILHTAQIRISVPSIEGTVVVSTPLPMERIFHAFTTEVDAASTLLTLFNRRSVGWYSVHAWITSPQQEGTRSLVLRRRFPSSETAAPRREVLVDHRALVDGGFATVRANFQESDGDGPLSRAIWYLAASRRQAPLSTQSMLVHVALETIVGSWDLPRAGAPRMTDELARDVRSTLSEALTAILSRPDMAPWVESIRRGMKSIGSPSFTDDVLAVVTSSQVRCADLWPPKAGGVVDGLRRAIKGRNGLLHGRGVQNLETAHADMVRQRVLSERLILKALKCPPEMLWNWHAEEVGDVNR